MAGGILFSAMMGMGVGVNWNGTAAAAMFTSLIGHLVYGLVLACTLSWLRRRAAPAS